VGAVSGVERDTRRSGGYGQKRRGHLRTVGERDEHAIVASDAGRVKNLDYIFDLGEQSTVGERRATRRRDGDRLRRQLGPAPK
jgi:hypothetical protein